MTGAAYDYALFGLRVRSTLELPELTPASGIESPDVTVREGRIDASGNAPGIAATQDGVLLTIEETGRFLVRDGSEIVVDPVDGIEPRNVRLYLLGSAFGILLHQRGLLPLHANAVEVDGQAIAFMGESGSGKSTLAAWFHDRGHRVLADDVCVVGAENNKGRLLAHVGVQRLRLWEDALEESGRQAKNFDRSYAQDSDWNKYDVPIGAERNLTPLPLAAIYLLARGESVDFDRLSGVEAIEAIFANTYRGYLVNALGDEQAHFRAAADLVSSVPVFRFERPWNVADRERAGEAVIAQFRSLQDRAVG